MTPRNAVIEALRSDGYAFLPGFTYWLDRLQPDQHGDAWTALRDPRVSDLLHSSPQQREQYFLCDNNEIETQKSVAYAGKSEKEHLTVVEGTAWPSCHPLLPAPVKTYLGEISAFLAQSRRLFSDLFPEIELPTILKARIFHYLSSDLLVGLRGRPIAPTAMRQHLDGSIFTLILANSDDCLQIHKNGTTFPLAGPHRRPFAVLIPGVAAFHDFQLQAMPHSVLPSAEPRTSVTVFLTPDLGSSRMHALQRLARWRCNPSQEAA